MSPIENPLGESVLKIAAVLPAYNEEKRVADVVKAVLRAPSVDEVIVVNDGSTDQTVKVACSIPGVEVVNLRHNVGKGGAMTAGANATDADILIFLDADLIGLKPEHVEELVAPVKTGRAKMAVGSFRGGRRLTDWAQKITPNISGQRAIRRSIFEQIPDLERTRYGVEMAITRWCHHFRIPSVTVLIPGVTHPMKEEKLGFFRGALSRARMYSQIFKIMLDPRAPKRARPKRRNILRTIAAHQRRAGNAESSASYWLYKKERSWKKRMKASRIGPTRRRA
jgi:polyisoprenyl-phosphate glycosyltransferase